MGDISNGVANTLHPAKKYTLQNIFLFTFLPDEVMDMGKVTVQVILLVGMKRTPEHIRKMDNSLLESQCSTKSNYP
jgi:hypothetical protein